MSVQRIHHYSISAPASILENMVIFYGDLLGLISGPRPNFGIPGYWLYASGEPILHLIEDENRTKTEIGYFDHIALRCEDRDGIRVKLDERNINYSHFEFLVGDTLQAQIIVTDPAANSLELNFLIT
tara:strand:- start:622 stop:1002 length:381 start_codon:yes stop_codon:yes gene_type:complete